MPTSTLSSARKRAQIVLRAEWVLFWAELATLIGVCVYLWLERMEESKNCSDYNSSSCSYINLNKLGDQIIVSSCVGSLALMINLCLNVLLRNGVVRGYGRQCLVWVWIRCGLLLVDIVVTILIISLCFKTSHGGMVSLMSVSLALYVYRVWTIKVINAFVSDVVYPRLHGGAGAGREIPLNNVGSPSAPVLP